MNQADLASKVAERVGLSESDAANTVEALFCAITKSLKAGDDVLLFGFGAFIATSHLKREWRNPKNNQTIVIPAGRVPRFSAGRALREAVNG